MSIAPDKEGYTIYQTVYPSFKYPDFCDNIHTPIIRFIWKWGLFTNKTEFIEKPSSCSSERNIDHETKYTFTIDDRKYEDIQEIENDFWIYKQKSNGGKKRTRRNRKSKYRKQRKSRKSKV
jgi:hypothetical protein